MIFGSKAKLAFENKISRCSLCLSKWNE